MGDTRVVEIREALIAVLSTAASIGIDVELLCHLAADELLEEQSQNKVKPFGAGAVYHLAACMNCVLEADSSRVFDG